MVSGHYGNNYDITENYYFKDINPWDHYNN